MPEARSGEAALEIIAPQAMTRDQIAPEQLGDAIGRAKFPARVPTIGFVHLTRRIEDDGAPIVEDTVGMEGDADGRATIDRISDARHGVGPLVKRGVMPRLVDYPRISRAQGDQPRLIRQSHTQRDTGSSQENRQR